MSENKTSEADSLLLEKYFRLGWLNKKYYSGKGYRQLYSAEDRLLAGAMLYTDFLKWGKGFLHVRNYAIPRVDCGNRFDEDFRETEHFRRALRHIPKEALPVLYKIVLEEKEIRPPRSLSDREKLYFCNEIKVMLCIGLDALVPFYK